MSRRQIALVALLVAAVPAAAVGAAAQDASADGYTGTHVSVETDGTALFDYRVDGETVVSTVEVQSASTVEGGFGLGATADLDAVTDVEGTAMSASTAANASARFEADSGATVDVHDDEHGTLVITAEDEQYVELELNATSEAEAEGDGVLVTTANGTQASVLVVGEGDATVDADGDVTARVESDSKLVVRSYTDARTEAEAEGDAEAEAEGDAETEAEAEAEGDAETEHLIANGTLTAEVYVDQRAGGTVAGSVTYDTNATVTAKTEAKNCVTVTVHEAGDDGAIVAVDASEVDADGRADLDVRVDGSAAVRASSYSELRAAAESDATAAYLVRGNASGDADAEVLVATAAEGTATVSSADHDADSHGDESEETASDGGTDSDAGESEASGEEENKAGVTGLATVGSAFGFEIVAGLLLSALGAGVGLTTG